jgi:hypothetical protein
VHRLESPTGELASDDEVMAALGWRARDYLYQATELVDDGQRSDDDGTWRRWRGFARRYDDGDEDVTTEGMSRPAIAYALRLRCAENLPLLLKAVSALFSTTPVDLTHDVDVPAATAAPAGRPAASRRGEVAHIVSVVAAVARATTVQPDGGGGGEFVLGGRAPFTVEEGLAIVWQAVGAGAWTRRRAAVVAV